MFQRICTQTIRIVAIIIIGTLTILSFLTTAVQEPYSYVDPDGNQIMHDLVYYRDDRTWAVLLFVIIATFIFSLFEYKFRDKGSKYRFRITLGIIYILITSTYLLTTQFDFYSDASKVVDSLIGIKNGDLISYEPEGYLFKYPFQAGYMLYENIFYSLLGGSGFLVARIFNVFELSIAYFFLIRISKKIFKEISEITLDILAFVCAIFLPMMLYTTFLYGIIPAFMFSLITFDRVVNVVEDFKWRDVIISAVSMALAIQFKSNSMIFMLAIFVYIIGVMFEKKKIILVVIPITIIANLLAGSVVKGTMHQMTGRDLPVGLPKTCWVVMGLEESPIAPGGFNGRGPSLSTENNYDYDATNNAAIGEIKGRLKKFVKEPKYMVGFFGRKISAQWNDPLFQSDLLIENRYDKNNKLYSYLTDGAGRNVIDFVLNGLHAWILLGSLMFFVCKRRKLSMEALVLIIAFVGGFFFHLIWESKSQYAVHYWVLLFPYAVLGYQYVAESMLYKIKVLNGK